VKIEIAAGGRLRTPVADRRCGDTGRDCGAWSAARDLLPAGGQWNPQRVLYRGTLAERQSRV